MNEIEYLVCFIHVSDSMKNGLKRIDVMIDGARLFQEEKFGSRLNGGGDWIESIEED